MRKSQVKTVDRGVVMVERRIRSMAAAWFSALLTAGFAAAEEPEAERLKKDIEEEIVVTGSRIKRKDLTTPAPVTMVTREQLETSGRISIGDFLQTLPAQGNALNTQVNNGGDGSIQISLRGLGVQRTLVLINGRRPAAGNDLSVIPTAIVDRVEVLQDGASAVYGSDAIGGVVNIITRKGFKGTELSAYGGLSQHLDGEVYDFSVISGQGTERGNVVFAAGFYEQGTVWAGDRAFSAIPRWYDYKTGNSLLMGSGIPPAGRINFDPDQMTNGSLLLSQLAQDYPGITDFIRCTPGDPVPCPHGWRPFRKLENGGVPLPTDPIAPGDGYNYQPRNYNVTPSRRITATSFGDLWLGSRTRAYYEASYVNRYSRQVLAPQPIFTLDEGVIISKDNSYNPFGVDVMDEAIRVSAFGNRVFEQDLNTFRIVAGFDGTLPRDLGLFKNVFWDLSFNHSRAHGSVTLGGLEHNTKIQAAVGPSWVDSAGKPHCGTDAAHDISGCVPLDLFHGEEGITADQVARMVFTGTGHGSTQLTGVQFNATAELFRLLAERPAALAIGYEYRAEYDEYIPDSIVQAHETESDIAADVLKGREHVNEGYVELSLPIVDKIVGIELLEASAAARLSDYSISGRGTNFKFGGRWQPVHDVTFRGTWSTAFRAPTIFDLYNPQISFFNSFYIDPCAGPGINPNSPLGQACGPAANNGGQQTAFRISAGGNPNLKPETARIFTAGLVLEPRFLPNFTATVDYYHYVIDQAITPFVDAALILDRCYPKSAGARPILCERVQRDPTTWQLIDVSAVEANVGAIRTDGIDVALRYALPTAVGRFAFGFDGVWLHRYDVEQPDGTVIRGRGTYDVAFVNGGFGGVFPAVKFNAGASWTFSGFTAAVNTRYIGSFRECGRRVLNDSLEPQPGDGIGPGYCFMDATYSRRVSHSNTWDLFASYAFKTAAGKTTIGAGVNNLFNRPPPQLYNSFAPNADPTTYDFVGRFVYGRILHKF